MTVSRRTWLSALAAAPIVGRRAWASKGSQDLQTDAEVWPVVVIGAGMAGLCAASAVLESGMKVLVLEKGPLIGGHSQYSSGSIAVVVPENPKPGLWTDSVDQFVKDALEVGGRKADPEMLFHLAQHSFEAFEWLKSCGLFFGPAFIAQSSSHPRCFAMPGSTAGLNYILAISEHVRKLEAAIRLNSQVTSFERRNDYWSIRIRETQNGQVRERLIAALSLIIASGGFTADVAKRMHIDSRLTSDMHTSANPFGTLWDGATGEMLDAAREAGAAITNGHGLQLLPYGGARLLRYVGGDIYVDSTGRRFVNEALPWHAIADKMLNLEDRSCWVITDSQSVKGDGLGLKLINGIVSKSQSIEEMARGMQVDPAVLRKTIEQYNTGVTKGLDTQTGKRIFTQKIDKPPFYWGHESIYVHTTLDGILTDTSAQVVSQNGDSLPGLFAAGEVACSFFGTDRLGGAGMTNCLVMGREAGKNAVKHALG